MSIVKDMNPYEKSSADLHVPPEEGVKQVVNSYKVSNSRSWQYLTELMLEVIRYLEGGPQEIPTTQKVALHRSVWRMQ